mgnify:CR=1 FL=1
MRHVILRPIQIEEETLKRFFVFAIMISLSLAVFAGGETEETGSAEGAAAPAAARTGKYGEAPDLAAMVKAGSLPPVDERLPENPVVGLVGGADGQAGVVRRRRNATARRRAG